MTSRSSSPGPGRDAAARRARVVRRATARSLDAGTDADSDKGEARAARKGNSSLTGRAFVVLISLGVIVVTLALPVRDWFAQRAELSALQDENAARAARVADLQHQLTRLKDPAYVTALVRDRLHYVLPGEIGYVVLDPQAAPAPGSKSGVENSAVSAQPWYSTLWGSVQAADGSATAPEVSSVRPDAPR